jgi:soluble lytic murein transglycosylase
LYYLDIVDSAAKQYGFDPLFLLSVIRQESLFDPSARSSYATGLMQITPDTGQLIADNLGWPPNYTSEDLFRPIININMGTAYLMDQRLHFAGDIYTVLAAYNAGPGTVPIWRDLSGQDSDLFLEVIRFEETRNYIINIYEAYTIYHEFYSTVP